MADPRELTILPTTWMQTDLGLPFFWDVRKLWAVDLPVVPMRVAELEWLLNKPFWKDGPPEVGATTSRGCGKPPALSDRLRPGDSRRPVLAHRRHLPSPSVDHHGWPTPPPEGLDVRPRDDLGKASPRATHPTLQSQADRSVEPSMIAPPGIYEGVGVGRTRPFAGGPQVRDVLDWSCRVS
jgi:hypothetical protein